MEILALWVRQKECETRVARSLVDTYHGLHWRVCSSGGARDIEGQTEICGATVMAGETATVAPMFGLPLGQTAYRCHLAYVEPSSLRTVSEASLT